MFWALNGATRTPWRASSRHSPATTNDFPRRWSSRIRGDRPLRTLEDGPRAVDRPRQHRSRQGQVLGRLRRDGAGAGPAAGTSGSSSSSRAASGRPASASWPTSSASSGTPWATGSPGVHRPGAHGRAGPPGLGAAAEKLASGDYDLLVLDEVTYPVKYGWIDAATVAGAIRTGRPRTSVVATGPGGSARADRRGRHRHRDAQGQARLRRGDLGLEGHRVLSRGPHSLAPEDPEPQRQQRPDQQVAGQRVDPELPHEVGGRGDLVG